MKNLMLRSILSVTAALAIVGGAAPTFAAPDAPLVVYGKSADGEVWVKLDLARLLADGEFVPMLIAVRNTSGDPVTLGRDSFAIIGADGRAARLPDLATFRDSYSRRGFDQTLLRADGLPIGTRLDRRTVEFANFFPDVTSASGVLRDEVVLPNLHWTADLFYFEPPVGLSQGREMVLKVQADGWEAPIRVRFSL